MSRYAHLLFVSAIAMIILLFTIGLPSAIVGHTLNQSPEMEDIFLKGR